MRRILVWVGVVLSAVLLILALRGLKLEEFAQNLGKANLLWLIPGILSLSGIFTLTAWFAGKNRMRVNITGSVYALIVILIGDIIFIPKYGINAAALVSSAGYIVYQVYIIVVFKKEYPCSAADFFIFRWSDWKQIKNSISVSFKKSNES